MKFFVTVLIVLGIISVGYFFYSGEGEMLYTDKEGLLRAEAGTVIVCRGFPRLRNLYVQSEEGSKSRAIMTALCENKLSQAIRSNREGQEEVTEFEETGATE